MWSSREAFLQAVGHVAEESPWVAERAWEHGPFADRAALLAAFAAVIEGASAADQVRLIRAHPDLAGRAALAGDLTPDSTSEQASAGLDRLTPADLARFTAANDAYRARFGFPFVICARRHTVASILDAYDRRLAGDPEAERRAALAEILAIIDLRVPPAP